MLPSYIVYSGSGFPLQLVEVDSKRHTSLQAGWKIPLDPESHV
jgi:hypothetical protein